MSCELSEQYLLGLRLFNDEEFFECHDVLEELWSEVIGEERDYYQGLIQASVALFHFGNENYGGAIKLYRSANKYLSNYPEQYLGIDLKKFLADFQECFQELLDFRGDYPSGIELDTNLLPKFDIPQRATEP